MLLMTLTTKLTVADSIPGTGKYLYDFLIILCTYLSMFINIYMYICCLVPIVQSFGYFEAKSNGLVVYYVPRFYYLLCVIIKTKLCITPFSM